ncbi:hypothetical protein NA57DRAFT_78571 [Rhizodiscina lignyota]|uniref:Fe2OG dioxygenase domain-containing protein n=1 Tax=Rhizodiscina lignyota TaxID=1504668 RepID=A0A9P4ICN2_9PEZI|nr:hypothetical protein NA57DRAFT_78571 [Rhizodiscina lignyota]
MTPPIAVDTLPSSNPAFQKIEPQITKAPFDPSKHLAFESPSEFYTLQQLGLPSEGSISPVAITAPFRLLSDAGIRAARADLFRREILQNYKWTEAKDPGVYKLRGYAQDTDFVRSLWTSPEMLAACSKAAGCELDVVFDYEIGHINVQLPPGQAETEEDIDRLLPPIEPVRQSATVDDAEAERAAKEGIANVTAWHNDSYPWVCVVMLSDPTGMKGGETALRKGDGSILKVRGPQCGYAVMMQGGLINHVALKALGEGERITMVTSFRPRDPYERDNSNLGNVKAVSDHGKLYTQWAVYRAEVMAKRAALFAEKLKESKKTADEVEKELGEWVKEQIKYLEHSARELTTDGEKGNYNHQRYRDTDGKS